MAKPTQTSAAKTRPLASLRSELPPTHNSDLPPQSPHNTPHTYPFLAPVKKNLTTNTCNPAIPTMHKFSTTENLKIRCSVDRTVLKLRFSRVRKYFWLRVMVESWPESL